jgi:predicted methyltransferase
MKYLVVLLAVLWTLPAKAELNWDWALSGPHRDPVNIGRNDARHPRETLEFFGLKEGMSVVELAPGGGWYTEVIAALLKDNGTYYAAHHGLNSPGAYYRNSLGKYLQKMASDADLYGDVIITQLQPPALVEVAPAGSADLVVGFRNVHSWMRGDILDSVLAAAYTALKPGGKLGIVQHRAKPGADVEAMKKSGYVTEAFVIESAEAAGFKLEASSDVNANPKDTADHPKGVWSLPPALRDEEGDREKYMAIGESDRMTLLFTKPAG